MNTMDWFERNSLLVTFQRSQVSGLLATLVDYGFLFSAVELLHIWYVLATAIGATLGAITNFLLNRYWTFRVSHQQWRKQFFRYVVVSAGSMGLNTAGVYFVTEFGKIHYAISVFVVSMAVAWLYNFPLHRHFVFPQ